MKPLTTYEIRQLLKEGKDKFLIVHYLQKNGETFIVRRDNPTVRIARVRRGILADFDTQIYSKPLQYYEFGQVEF